VESGAVTGSVGVWWAVSGPSYGSDKYFTLYGAICDSGLWSAICGVAAMAFVAIRGWYIETWSAGAFATDDTKTSDTHQ
jgi:hypothetical protein